MFHPKILASTLLALILSLEGCAYHMQIEQGVALAPAQISQVKPGMTKNQVQYVLGTPNLIDPYHSDRWYYIYTNKENRTPLVQQNWVVYFDAQGRMLRIQALPTPTGS